MNIYCGYSKCDKKANWECQEGLEFCEYHIRKHSSEKNCYCKPYGLHILRNQAKKKQNALNKLTLQSVQLAGIMINEISNCLDANFACINYKKNQIMDFVLNKQSKQVDKIILWGNNFDLLNRDKTHFINIAKNLLCIENNSINIISELEQLKKEIEVLKNKYKESCEKAIEKENELIRYKNNYQILQKEIGFYSKKYFEAHGKFLSIKNELNNSEQTCREMHEKINACEAVKLFYMKNCNEAYGRINDLVIELEIIKRIEGESERKNIESLIKANDRIKKLEFESKNNTLAHQKNKEDYENALAKAYERIDMHIVDEKEIKSSLESANKKNKLLEDELQKSQKIIQEKFEELKEYEDHLKTRKLSCKQKRDYSLEQANIRIRILENELENFIKVDQENKNKINYYESELQIRLESLRIASSEIETLQDELRNLQVKSNPAPENIAKEKNIKRRQKNGEKEKEKEKEKERQRQRQIKMQFISNFQPDGFSRMDQKQKSDHLFTEGFERYKEDIINKNQPILNIKMTNNYQYVFVCNHKADCINHIGMLI